MNDEINWQPEFELNIESIDNQHKTWIAMMNKLKNSVGKQDRLERIKAIFLEMEKFVGFHFTYEENLLKEHGYPMTEEHTECHNEFMKTLQDMRFRLEQNNDIMAAEVLMNLNKWLQEHILGDDKKYAPFLREKGVK